MRKGNTINIDGEPYSSCTKIEFMIEKYFPEMTQKEYREFSVKEIGDMMEQVTKTEQVLNEASA